MATPLPLLRLERSESHPYRRHAGFQSLLDSGTVLGYEVYIKSHIDGVATGSHIRIAMADGVDGVRWLDTVDAILAEEARIPGVVLAGFTLLADLWCTVCPKPMLSAWQPHNPDSDESVSYAQVFVARYGYVVGIDNPEQSIEHRLDELDEELEYCEDDAERDRAVEEWDIGQVAAIALVGGPNPSAHQRLLETEQAAHTFAAWEQAYPGWRDRGLALCAPTA
jgi:hypothetical protein